MKFIYSTSIFLYSLLVKLASFFNKKAKLRHKGSKNTFKNIQNFIAEKTIWIHCASLGEFEQGRPIIELIKKTKPEYKIALSFYSPSGYEIRKNYENADIVFYLPDDNKKNARKLIKILNPEITFFIKYEFWYWYLNELRNKSIPSYLISGIFRNEQVFFKFYGSFYRKILHNFSHLFVQNKTSKELLKSINIENVSVVGDTRFDRVIEISENSKKFPLIDKFTKNKLVFIAGSTWKPDEEIIFNFINKNEDKNIKFIIAPHEIKNENINRINNLSNKKTLRLSLADSNNIEEVKILIIDNIGMLSSLYSYGDIAYIGGGFGAGIHNTLEAAVFGIPVIFGKKYHKFDEAIALLNRKAAFSISNKKDFNSILKNLISNENFRNETGDNAKTYIKENANISKKILNKIDF